MKSTRVYKTKMRQSILRQMLFTDRNLLIGSLLVIGLGIFFGLPHVSIANRILLTIILSGIGLTIASYQIDGQPFISLIPRMVQFILRKKKTRL